eukprot:CAMPEP_0185797350 /NCGR_PEP_ID=MMETSP1174-20130828/161569_1 /TAXON_ID=35687 /ORGANISM="Dictyocha speculum, Strain CCMP1381" /LENGTH=155 /DNA_ID=CAMNT_0028492775 /DNA_START=407 /DNA_END=874 /DNA_ORIENTATION=-
MSSEGEEMEPYGYGTVLEEGEEDDALDDEELKEGASGSKDLVTLLEEYDEAVDGMTGDDKHHVIDDHREPPSVDSGDGQHAGADRVGWHDGYVEHDSKPAVVYEVVPHAPVRQDVDRVTAYGVPIGRIVGHHLQYAVVVVVDTVVLFIIASHDLR